MNKWLKRRDIILILSLIIIGLVLLIIWRFIYSDKGSFVTIDMRGERVGEYPLNKDDIIPLSYRGEETNILIIEDGYCYMKYANCPDKLCKRQGKINRSGQTIVCLPNRIVVTVVERVDKSYDSIAS